jgi:hypothetical protein
VNCQPANESATANETKRKMLLRQEARDPVHTGALLAPVAPQRVLPYSFIVSSRACHPFHFLRMDLPDHRLLKSESTSSRIARTSVCTRHSPPYCCYCRCHRPFPPESGTRPSASPRSQQRHPSPHKNRVHQYVYGSDLWR